MNSINLYSYRRLSETSDQGEYRLLLDDKELVAFDFQPMSESCKKESYQYRRTRMKYEIETRQPLSEMRDLQSSKHTHDYDENSYQSLSAIISSSHSGSQNVGYTAIKTVTVKTKINRYPGKLSISESLGRTPVFLECCPVCNSLSTTTRIRTYPNYVTWACVGVSALVFWPILWLPLVLDEMKQTDHFCADCGAKVGEVAALEDCCVKEAGWPDS